MLSTSHTLLLLFFFLQEHIFNVMSEVINLTYSIIFINIITSHDILRRINLP